MLSTADANGYFSFDCASTDGYMMVNAPAFSNASATVRGKAGSSVTGNLYVYPGVSFQLAAANDVAGLVYDRLREHVPTAAQRFGRTRSAISVYAAADNDSLYNPQYLSSVDRILYNNTRTYDQDARFIIVHEYGHAFQAKAIEPWNSYYCSPNGTHAVNGSYTLSCAYVEGFADFFSAWIAGSDLTSNYSFSDYYFELNSFRSIGNGSIIEGAVAGFLLDLVDGPGDPDQIIADDESLVYTGSQVESVMRTCGLSGGVTQLDGIDQFIYCAERNIGAWVNNPYANWRMYSSYSTQGSGTWDAAKVRTLWRYDLFNTGSLP